MNIIDIESISKTNKNKTKYFRLRLYYEVR